MKHFISVIIAIVLLLPLGACRSGSNAVKQSERELETATWQNVTLPVKVAISKPYSVSFNGTATLVRGKYVLISLRFLGFEVGQLHITPEEADVVLKQPSKIWMQTSVGERLKKSGLSFTALQETLMGNRDFLSRLPREINVEFSGTEKNPRVRVWGTFKGKQIDATLSWELSSAKWDTTSPRTFSTPGSKYRKTTLEGALKALKGI